MKVGLVLVSHSRQLAEGLKEIIGQVTQGSVIVATAGGMEDGRLGTDVLAVQRAIEGVARSGAALVLMDLGSSVLGAETALDQLPVELRERVRLVDAPLVEGGVAAAVEASLDSSLDAVADAAEAARTTPKLG